MRYCVNYSEGGITYTLYSATRKEAEALALKLIADGHDDVALVDRPKPGDALAHLILAKGPKLPLWKLT